MKITEQILKDRNACPSQVDTFTEVFPDGATVTLANLARAHKAGLDVGWLINLLPAPARAEYRKAIAPAWAMADKAIASAWVEYDKAVAPARAEYHKAIAPAWAEYHKAIASAWAEYHKAIAPARAEYQKTVDCALVAAFRRMRA